MQHKACQALHETVPLLEFDVVGTSTGSIFLLPRLLRGMTAAHGVAVFASHGPLLQANPAFFRLCPPSPAHLLRPMDLFHDFTICAETQAKIISGRLATCISCYLDSVQTREAGAFPRNVELTVVPIPAVKKLIVVVQSLTQLQRGVVVMDDLDTYQFITDKLEDVIILQDLQFSILYANESVHRLLGYTQDNLMHRNSLSLYHPDDQEKVHTYFEYGETEEGLKALEVRMRHNEGHYVWIETRARRFVSGSMHTVLVVNRDISQRKQTEEQIKFLTFHDSLTGVFNRNYFEQEMNRVAEGRYREAGLIVCDVDGLKFINDTLGHKSGDDLIKSAAEVILSSFRVSDMIARIGGDEFAILLPNASKPDLVRAIKRIHKNMRKHNAAKPTLPLHISLGYAHADHPNFDIHALFKQADDAMYRNKLHNKRKLKSNSLHILLTILKEIQPENEKRSALLEKIMQTFVHSLEFSDQEKDLLLLFAKVYNIGVLGLPEEEIRRAEEKRDLVSLRKQAETGYRIARYTKELEPLADWILKQHEWWNGQEGILGLREEEIPLPSRIMAVAGTYACLTIPPPHRPALTHAQTMAELKKKAGTRFDPALVQILAEHHHELAQDNRL